MVKSRSPKDRPQPLWVRVRVVGVDFTPDRPNRSEMESFESAGVAGSHLWFAGGQRRPARSGRPTKLTPQTARIAGLPGFRVKFELADFGLAKMAQDPVRSEADRTLTEGPTRPGTRETIPE